MTLTPPRHLPGGMKAWLCEYRKEDGNIYGIVLNGRDPEQIIRDNREQLRDLVVLGEHGGTVSAEGEE